MAAVIRAATIDPERMVIPLRARSNPPPRQQAQPAVAEPGLVPAVAPVAPATPVVPAVPPSWIDPVTAQDIEPELDDVAAEFDRELIERDFRAQLEAEREQVLERAHAEGFEHGARDGRAEYRGQVDTLSALLESASDTLAGEIAGTEDIIVDIAFEAVCKILGEAALSRDGVVAIVREILRKVRERERLLVRVAPADLTALEENRAQLALGEEGATLDLVADERVALGGCLVETTGGTLDGRLETQLQRLIETLTSARRMQGEAAI